jgi:oligopeptide transport system permease protein
MAVGTAGRLPAVADPTYSAGFWSLAWRRFRRNRAAVVGGSVVLVVIVTAIFAGPIAPYGANEQFLRISTPSADQPLNALAQRDTGKYEKSSATHIFGTDHLARDIFSRTVLGLRISLSAAFFAILFVTVVGVLVGVVSAAGPRWIDDVMMRGTDIAYAFPDLLLIILLRAAFGDSIFGMRQILGMEASVFLLFLAISLTAWPTMARLVRGQLLSIRELDYSAAAVAIGASKTRIAVRHWLPNAMAPVIVEVTFLVPRAIFAEAALTFIGVGVPAPAPSLGRLIDDHFRFVLIQWHALAFPTGVLALLFLSFQFFGDGMRDALDPRSRR